MEINKWVDKNKNTFRAKDTRKVWFGKYSGFMVKDIPTEYLEWFCSNYNNPDKQSLRKFERRALTMFLLELKKRA